MDDPVTEEFVQELAEGVLGEWLDGANIGALTDTHQRKVSHSHENFYVVRDLGGNNSERLFEVTVTVKEVK